MSASVVHRSAAFNLAANVPDVQVHPVASGATRHLRLRLSPSIGSGALDGAWWPYSRDLATEVVSLVDGFPGSYGPLSRVVYSGPDWGRAPRRLRAARTFINLESFPHDDTHLVMVKGAGAGSHRVLKLLVVPPEWDDRAAVHVMRIAAMPSNHSSAATILTDAEDAYRPGLLSHWNDDGGSNLDV